jgi:hypothetical protein
MPEPYKNFIYSFVLCLKGIASICCAIYAEIACPSVLMDYPVAGNDKGQIIAGNDITRCSGCIFIPC